MHCYFFMKKEEESLQFKGFFTLFQQTNNQCIYNIAIWNFTESLTNDIVNFEQLVPSHLFNRMMAVAF